MTTDLAALLRAICADPHDMAARLVYADLLEERGDPDGRGEFVRVQCELAHTPEWLPIGKTNMGELRVLNKRHTELRRRERELLLANWLQWTPRLSKEKSWELILSSKWVYAGTPACSFRRGFVESVHCTCADWLQHGPTIIAAQPICEVVLTDREPWGGYLMGRADRTAHNFIWSSDFDWKIVAHSLPREIRREIEHQPGSHLYPTRDAALSALSAACVAWARERAGLSCSTAMTGGCAISVGLPW